MHLNLVFYNKAKTNYGNLMSTFHRNTILKEIHNFVHLNLAIALFLALTVFVAGIETANKNKVGYPLHTTNQNGAFADCLYCSSCSIALLVHSCVQLDVV